MSLIGKEYHGSQSIKQFKWEGMMEDISIYRKESWRIFLYMYFYICFYISRVFKHSGFGETSGAARP